MTVLYELFNASARDGKTRLMVSLTSLLVNRDARQNERRWIDVSSFKTLTGHEDTQGGKIMVHPGGFWSR
jgi:hypothetical protein